MADLSFALFPSWEHQRPTITRYGMAVLAVVFFTLLRWPLQPWLGNNVPFLLFFPAILWSGCYGGLGPGLFASALSALSAQIFFVDPALSLTSSNPASVIELVLFSLVCIFMSLLADALLRARHRAEAAAAEVRRQTEGIRQAEAEKREDEKELRRLLAVQESDREELAVMSRIERLLSAQLDFDSLAQILTDEATTATNAQFGAFFYNVVSERQDSYMLYTLSGVPREAFAGFPMPRSTDVFGPTFRGEGIVRSDDITRDPRYGRNEPYKGMPPGHLPVRSYLAAPVHSHSGEVLGGLFFGHSTPGVFGERSERILAGIASQAAVAFDNARLFRDVQEAREQAEGASRSKDEFLATVSHELRTPLNAMMGWAQLLQMGTGDDAGKLDRGLDIIVRNAKLQAQLIDDLLDVSRIVSGKMRLDVRSLELVPVVEAAVESVRPAAEAKQIRLRRVLDPQAGPVAGDSDRLQQVVWNLLSNAVKFTPKGGRVEVRLERVNSHVEIIVADTGAGIRPEFVPHVFDRFRQQDSSSTRKQGGLGLGLAIVRHLAELHGGTVEVNSPGEDKGSTFVVALPLSVAQLDDSGWKRTHPKARNGAPLQDSALDLAGIRVLVVDDEADARETLTQILERCHAEVLAVGSAREALQELERYRPDVLLSDIGMPEQDGYDLIRQVRALPSDRGGRTPAVALTAFARGEDRRRALLAGFQMHVAKPVDVKDLAAVVSNLAGGAR